ncbi:tripartite tricarboxylate transporter substrate binding protein [Orrella sp. NBD-18]|uniref:Tripartite tricarboxylate transporter substrate binding protein n=2 Tax=Sheuella amnicola TaxID=2707330 RepID=A0A6B2RAB1_9BURK|nr:tripartite tricarboxylate transporter substrate binding protein [Sheuella amnicola]
MQVKWWKSLMATAIGVVLSGVCFAQPAAQTSDAWPVRPLRFVVPYPPGGPLDSMARLLAEKAKSSLGQTIIVENKPGAGGNIGADIVAKAAPDGYTLVMGAVATHAINPWLFASIPYDSVRDFAPVVLVASVPNVLVLNKDFAARENIRSLPDLIEYARKNPGKLNYGSGGSGSAGHLSAELLRTRANIDVVHIPYQGAAPAQLALLSGQSDFMFDNLAASAPLIQDGKVIALAVTTLKRSALLPDVPTVEESGIRPFDIGTWFGVFTTAGTPEAIVQKLYGAYENALKDPAVIERLKLMGSNAELMSSTGFADFVRLELEKYKEIVKVSGAKVN